MELMINGTKEFCISLSLQEACEIGILDISKGDVVLIGSITADFIHQTYNELCRSIHTSCVALEGKTFYSVEPDGTIHLKFIGDNDIFDETPATANKDNSFTVTARKRQMEDMPTDQGCDEYYAIKLNNIDELLMACKLFSAHIDLAFANLYIMKDHTYRLIFDSKDPDTFDRIIEYMFYEHFDDSNIVQETRDYIKEHAISVMEDAMQLALL